MRHTVYLLLGKDLLDIAPALKQYTLMYGEGDAPEYLQVLSCVTGEFENSLCVKSHIHAKSEVERVFTSGLENRFRLGVDHKEELENDAVLRQYFTSIFNRTVTIEDPGSDGSLNICLFLPLYDEHLWNIAKRLIKIIKETKKQIRIDVLGLPSEISLLLSSKEEAKEIASNIDSYKDTCRKIGNELIDVDDIHRFILFEDTNSSGLALNLDLDRLIRVLGEFALLYVEHYHVIFPSNLLDKKVDVTTFGLSLMAFDKIYFVHYLLRKAYLYVLNREKVNDEEKININHAAEIAQKMLEKHVNLYKDFVRDNVDPTIAKCHNGTVQLSDTQRLEADLNKEIEEAIEDLQAFISDPNLSLPEKQAIMAQLLGEDDALVEGVQYFKEQLILDDCDEETLDFLIAEDNRRVVNIPATDESPARVEHGILKAPREKDTNRVYLPLKEIKLLRAKIRQRTTYIRKKSEELESIEIQVQEAESIQKRLSEEGFKFGDEVFKLLPTKLDTRLFKETYTPINNNEQSVDLRESFTPVKTQGKLGACSAFALVSIFEYILKKTDPSNPDLSERFAYYNALRKNQGTDKVSDEGSSLYDIVESLSNEGLASESVCPYSERLEKPSNEAYEDGKKRLVKVAKNVNINHTSLTSALAEGYPVAISLRVFDSFIADKNGFVYRPTEDEITAGDSGNHAMVICGYSEEDKIYIVRNSWGTVFGDRGYCYIPFSYIDDPTLNNQACIITDIEVETKIKVSGREKKTVSFNLTDDNIRQAILRILIDEEKIALKTDSQKYAKLRYDYENLLQVLANPTKRDEIYESSYQMLTKQIEQEKEKYDSFTKNERPLSLKSFKDMTLKMGLYDAGFIIILCGLVALFFKLGLEQTTFISLIVLAVVVVLSILFFWYRKYLKSMLKKELDEKSAKILSHINQLTKEREEKHLRMHLAGKVISSLTDTKLKLVDRYHSLVSYNMALKQWEAEERKKLSEMVIPNKTPSIPLLDNDVLDEYFEAHKESITSEICLYELLGRKSMSDEDVLKFKFTLRDKIIEKLEKEFETFSMMDYVIKKDNYNYLKDGSNILEDTLPLMDVRSTIFLNIYQNGEIHDDCLEKHLFIHSDKQTDRNSWRESYEMSFTKQPSDNDLDSKYKLIELQVQHLTKDQVSLLN